MSCKSFLYILDVNLLSDIRFANILGVNGNDFIEIVLVLNKKYPQMDRKEGKKVKDIQETDTNVNDYNNGDGGAPQTFLTG